MRVTMFMRILRHLMLLRQHFLRVLFFSAWGKKNQPPAKLKFSLYTSLLPETGVRDAARSHYTWNVQLLDRSIRKKKLLS